MLMRQASRGVEGDACTGAGKDLPQRTLGEEKERGRGGPLTPRAHKATVPVGLREPHPSLSESASLEHQAFALIKLSFCKPVLLSLLISCEGQGQVTICSRSVSRKEVELGF